MQILSTAIMHYDLTNLTSDEVRLIISGLDELLKLKGDNESAYQQILKMIDSLESILQPEAIPEVASKEIAIVGKSDTDITTHVRRLSPFGFAFVPSMFTPDNMQHNCTKVQMFTYGKQGQLSIADWDNSADFNDAKSADKKVWFNRPCTEAIHSFLCNKGTSALGNLSTRDSRNKYFLNVYYNNKGRKSIEKNMWLSYDSLKNVVTIEKDDTKITLSSLYDIISLREFLTYHLEEDE